jgi:hypothetical protein
MKFGENWYQPETLGGYDWIWMSQNSTIYFLNPLETKKEISFLVQSYFKPRKLDIFVSDKLVNSRKILPDIPTKLTINMSPGFNVIKFVSEEGCEVPFEVEESTDKRCLSFSVIITEEIKQLVKHNQ